MSVLGNGASGQMNVQVIEWRRFEQFGYEVSAPRPGADGVPVRDLLFATPAGVVYCFPLNAFVIAELRKKLDNLIAADAD